MVKASDDDVENVNDDDEGHFKRPADGPRGKDRRMTGERVKRRTQRRTKRKTSDKLLSRRVAN